MNRFVDPLLVLDELSDDTLRRIALSDGAIALPGQAASVLEHRLKKRNIDWVKWGVVAALVFGLAGLSFSVYAYINPPNPPVAQH